MLHLNTIDTNTHNTLLSFCSKDYLANFSLVGGTNLSLRFGHRKSIDLDMFAIEQFDPVALNELLYLEYANRFRSNNKYMLFTYINDVKVDWVYHPFHLLAPIEIIDGIRFFSIEDVAAMKLFAITKRGTKKDFFDVYQLLNLFSPHELKGLFEKKYGYDKIWMMEMSMVYFDDADTEDDPVILKQGMTWGKVKQTIKNEFQP
ncbi:MAG: nucleotidyl transferase AbiEii/AbiGii toxin family protein [Niabella sp.]